MTAEFLYHAPKTLEEVDEVFATCGPTPRFLAGGTDLVVQLNSNHSDISDLVDLNYIPELCRIQDLPDGGIRIGAMVRLSDLLTHPRISAEYPALWEGAITVGSVQIRNRATLAGNVCNASPAADTVPGLLVYRAKVNVKGPSGFRSVPIDRFFLNPGHTALRRGEWVTSIDLPLVRNHGACYLKLGRTRGVDLAIVGVAVYCEETEARAAYSSEAPTPVLVQNIGQTLFACTDDSELRRMIENIIKSALRPIDDVRASAEYRLAMANILTLRAWKKANIRKNNKLGG